MNFGEVTLDGARIAAIEGVPISPESAARAQFISLDAQLLLADPP